MNQQITRRTFVGCSLIVAGALAAGESFSLFYPTKAFAAVDEPDTFASRGRLVCNMRKVTPGDDNGFGTLCPGETMSWVVLTNQSRFNSIVRPLSLEDGLESFTIIIPEDAIPEDGIGSIEWPQTASIPDVPIIYTGWYKDSEPMSSLVTGYKRLSYLGSTNADVAEAETGVFSEVNRYDKGTAFGIKAKAEGICKLHFVLGSSYESLRDESVTGTDTNSATISACRDIISLEVRVGSGSYVEPVWSDDLDCTAFRLGEVVVDDSSRTWYPAFMGIGQCNAEGNVIPLTIQKRRANTAFLEYRATTSVDWLNPKLTITYLLSNPTLNGDWYSRDDEGAALFFSNTILSQMRLVDADSIDLEELTGLSLNDTIAYSDDQTLYLDGEVKYEEFINLSKLDSSDKLELPEDWDKYYASVSEYDSTHCRLDATVSVAEGILNPGTEYALYIPNLPRTNKPYVYVGSTNIFCSYNLVDGDVIFRFRTADAIEATGVELNKESLLMAVPNGDAFATFALTATITTEDGTGNSTGGVTWVSSDESIATVDENGLVTALATGEAVITATAAYPEDGSVSDECAIKVVVPPESVSFGKDAAASVFVGSTFSLADPVVEPAGAYFEGFEWASSDPEVAVYADGKVSTLAEGAATISATLMGLNGIIVPDEAQTPPLSADFMVDVLLAPYDGSNTDNDQGGLQAGSGSPTSGAENGTGGGGPIEATPLAKTGDAFGAVAGIAAVAAVASAGAMAVAAQNVTEKESE